MIERKTLPELEREEVDLICKTVHRHGANKIRFDEELNAFRSKVWLSEENVKKAIDEVRNKDLNYRGGYGLNKAHHIACELIKRKIFGVDE